MSEFGKATVLVKEIEKLIKKHGDELVISFYVDEKTIDTSIGSVIGAIKIDQVEKTKPPRLDLTYR